MVNVKFLVKNASIALKLNLQAPINFTFKRNEVRIKSVFHVCCVSFRLGYNMGESNALKKDRLVTFSTESCLNQIVTTLSFNL